MLRILFIIILLVHFQAYGQKESQGKITPEILQRIKIEVEKDVAKFKESIAELYWNENEVAFCIDTFRIEQIAAKRMDIDYTTHGMSITVNEMTKSYDQLMNKYYNKLLQKLDKEDKKILITAQKAWLNYRNAEDELIIIMTKEKYSGGGTIQSNIVAGSRSDLVIKRAIDIFNYYNSMLKN